MKSECDEVLDIAVSLASEAPVIEPDRSTYGLLPDCILGRFHKSYDRKRTGSSGLERNGGDADR